MTLSDLLAELQARGVVLTADGDRIHFKGPRTVITDKLRATLTRYKPAILRALEQSRPAPRTIDGHTVESILWETERAVIFRDPQGKVWRRVHAWGMTWPVTEGASP